jgi:Bacterial SH3 domain
MCIKSYRRVQYQATILALPTWRKDHLMRRFRSLAWFMPVIILSTLLAPSPAHANVTAIVLHTRTCGTVSAFLRYDSFSEGNAPFWAVFAVDLNNNGIFGEAGEPIRYVRVAPTGEQQIVGARMVFRALPEGSSIAVTAYEVDSTGVPVSRQIEPVRYECAHRPAKDPLPPNTGIPIPGVGIVAKIRVAALTVYSGPSVNTEPLGGLGRGALVNVVARNQRGDWVQIQFKGQLGWIMWQTQALLLGPYSTLPVLPNFESPTP